MSKIDYAPLTEVIRRRFQADSDPSMGDQWQPCIVLESDRPEWAFLAQEMLAAGRMAVNNTPGTVNFYYQLLNPSGSRVIATLVRAQIIHAGLSLFGPSTMSIGEYSPALTDLQLVQKVRDFRWNVGGATRRGTCQLRSQVTALGSPLGVDVFGELDYRFSQTLAAASFYGGFWDQPVVLPPGTGVVVAVNGQGAARNDVNVTFSWRERAMSSWEISATTG